MIYTSFQQLNGKTLRKSDTLMFPTVHGTTLPAKVVEVEPFMLEPTKKKIKCIPFLDMGTPGVHPYSPDLFSLLGINPEQRFNLAFLSFGYPCTEDRVFPQPKPEDYSALTRLALVMFAICEGTYSIQVGKLGNPWGLPAYTDFTPFVQHVVEI